ncbi:hypothetical protein C6P40_001207 [Pichia californica]|uniref:Uncharacterized protein n=1 Tax=Pichia californica TaxID=460514 RepID=A0A9P6WLD9_9ASCO|nr:hypothetical protein C6P42_000288 [[Candida] californica]KAG0688252.1 hypothetical protein C6P40_001207 [[Candida] californica]
MSVPSLTIPICGYGEEPRIFKFEDKTKDPNSHIKINYDAYQSYINENYPDLYTIDIKYEFEQQINEKRKKNLNNYIGSNEEKFDLIEFNRQFKHENKLLNKLDIEQFKNLDSADDIWDSIAKSIYNMGYFGKYSRIALSLESGINYIFSFKDFAHIYPFLKTHQGDGGTLRRLKNLKLNEFKRFNSYKLHYETCVENRLGCAAEHYYSLKDLESFKRSPFNNSLLLKSEFDNPPGSEWSYLSVDKEIVEIGNSYRRGYEYVIPNLESKEESELNTSEELNIDNDINNDNDTDNDNDNSKNDSPFSNFEGGRYIYEKFLFCTTKGCSGTMRIILDCIHNVVILSTINQHSDCNESQKRQVYDIVRKLFVIHNGDLEKIDKKYATIPRRYGLTYIESWINFDEFEYIRSCEYFPSFFRYSFDDSISDKSWASQKNRNWIIDTFYEMEGDAAEKFDILNKNLSDNFSKIKNRQIPTHLKKSQKFLINSQQSYDLRNYGIKNWNSNSYRFDKFGNIIRRGEWEFNINQDCDGKLREIYRIWRKKYFGISDFLRQNVYSLSINKNFQMISKFLINNGGGIDSNKINIFSFNNNNNNNNNDDDIKFLNDIFASIKDSSRFNWNNFDKILFRINETMKILPNPEFFIIPYPLNRKISNHLLNKEIDHNPIIKQDKGCIFVCDLPIDKLFNSSDIFIFERNITYQSVRSIERKIFNLRKNSIHPSDQFLEFQPTFKESLFMMQIFDSEFLKGRYISKRFSSDKLLKNSIIENKEKFDDILDDDVRKFSNCKFTNKKPPSKSENYSKSHYSGYSLLFKDGGEMKSGFLFINKKNINEVIKLIQLKRTNPLKLDLVLITDYKYGLVENTNNINVIQLNLIELSKLKMFMPLDLILLLINAVISNNDLNEIENLLKRKLPPQRRSDIDFFQLEYEGFPIALNAGRSRSAINKLVSLIKYLNKSENIWRIKKSNNNVNYLSELKDGEQKIIGLNDETLEFLSIINMLGRIKNDEHNLSVFSNENNISKFQTAVSEFIKNEVKINKYELLAGEYRDLFELIKRSIDFLQ